MTIVLGLLLLALPRLSAVADEFPPEVRMVGVNLAGGEFGRTPGVFNKDYTYPGVKQFDYCRKKGLRVIRLPFKWERIQPKLMSPLDRDELGRLDDVVALARERELRLVLDMHNYARYGGELVGTEKVPNAALADVWKRLAEHYRDEAAVFAYGIMNEPHGTKGLWPAAAQAAVDAIRSVDKQHTILVCGDGWSGAHSWRKHNEEFLLNDPANNLVYEAHQYFDRNNTGSYKRSYDEERAHPNIGVDRLQPFLQWLGQHKVRGFIGEFGVPDNDPRWLVVLDNTLAEMRKHHVGGTYWAAGPWWGDYPLSVEPRDGGDRPQMAVIEHYLHPQTQGTAKPWVAAAQAAELAAQKAREADARLGPRIHDFGLRKESYHYANADSEFDSMAADDDGRKARKFTFTHKGEPAWVGVGVFFGSLRCEGHEAFSLELRAEKPCRLEIKVYNTAGQRYTATYEVSANWQTLAIPFADLESDDASFVPDKPVQKIEFQSSASRAGNAVLLGAFRLTRKPEVKTEAEKSD